MPPALVCTAAGEKMHSDSLGCGRRQEGERQRKKVLALSFLVNHVIQHPSKSCQFSPQALSLVSHLVVAGGAPATSISLPTVSFAS